MDNSGSFTRALVGWISGSHRWWANSPAARNCADRLGYQSGIRAAGGLAEYIRIELVGFRC